MLSDLDLLRRCRLHHLRVNLSMRPAFQDGLNGGTQSAVETAWKNERSIVETFHLAQDDNIFAYEVDWEPSYGTQETRRRLDPDWRQWVTAHYPSLADAERAWGVPAPKDAQGALTNPSGAQMSASGGPDTKLVAAYRHFLDDWLVASYGTLARRLHALDPNHPVSFRMASSGDPTNNSAGEAPYQFEGLARAVDFLSPECYGRIGSAEREKSIRFEIAYGRAVAPTMPIIWAETGVSAWEETEQADDPEALAFEGHYFDLFYRLARQSGADGIFWWWYPGGYRTGERSDYGIINPDGTDRPATTAIRQQGPLFLSDPPPAPPNVVLTYTRDAHPDGIFGIYRALEAPFYDAIAHGRRPGLKPVTP